LLNPLGGAKAYLRGSADYSSGFEVGEKSLNQADGTIFEIARNKYCWFISLKTNLRKLNELN